MNSAGLAWRTFPPRSAVLAHQHHPQIVRHGRDGVRVGVQHAQLDVNVVAGAKRAHASAPCRLARSASIPLFMELPSPSWRARIALTRATQPPTINLDGNRFSVLCMVARAHTSRQGLYSREGCPSLGISMIDTSGSILTMPSSPSTPIRCPWSPCQAATARACDATHATRRLHSCAAQRSEAKGESRGEGRK